MHQGRSVFAQLVEQLPRRAFDHAVQRYRGQRRVRALTCMDQLLCMIFAQITGRSSLRETVTCLQALGTQRYHCGIRGRVARSTLADANESRDHRIFMDTAMAMIAAAQLDLPVDTSLRRFRTGVYAIDSTTIDLCLKLFPWAHFRRRKGGVKAHSMLDLRAGIPVFLRISPAQTHDIHMLDWITPQAGAYYVIDKGYIDFDRLHRLHTAGAFFITRAKRNMDFGVIQRRAIHSQTGVKRDRLIRLRGPKSRQLYPDTLRLIAYVDPDTGKRLAFLTNHHTLKAHTVALLYHHRWRIELFFKWIKQHLHIKAFFGTTPNAVKTQVWIAVIVYLLVVKLKHRHQLPYDLNKIFQVLSVTILEKTPVFELFSPTSMPDSESEDRNQLTLFDI
jgi:transposase